MGRKKGKQSFGFTSKAQRAEWQMQVTEAMETLRRRQRPSSSSIHSSNSSINNPAQQHRVVRLKTLRNILQERVLLDEMEHRETSRQQRLLLQQQQQQQSQQQSQPRPNSTMTTSCTVKLPPPGSLVYYTKSDQDDNDDEGAENRPATRLLSLQMLCVQTLGPILPHYIQAMGVEAVHHCLSLLPGPTLTALSVVVARRAASTSTSSSSSTSTTTTIKMNRELVHILGNHPHVQRLALVRIPEAAMLQDLIPRVRHNVPLAQLQVHIPDCWEDDDVDDHNNHEYDEYEVHGEDHHHHDNKYYHHSHMPSLLGCTQLQRLELSHCMVGCRRWTAIEPLRDLFTKCGSTLQYIGLIHSLHVHTGPGLVGLLPTLVPHLRLLDVSDNDWITESVLRQFWQGYINNYAKKEKEKKQLQEEENDKIQPPSSPNDEKNQDETVVQEEENQDDMEHDNDADTNKTDHESDDDDDNDSLYHDNNIPSYAQQPIPQHAIDLLPVVRALACPNLVTSMKLGLELDFPNRLIHK